MNKQTGTIVVLHSVDVYIVATLVLHLVHGVSRCVHDVHAVHIIWCPSAPPIRSELVRVISTGDPRKICSVARVYSANRAHARRLGAAERPTHLVDDCLILLDQLNFLQIIAVGLFWPKGAKLDRGCRGIKNWPKAEKDTKE